MNILFSPTELKNLKKEIKKQKKNYAINNKDTEPLNKLYSVIYNIEYHNKK